MKEFDFLGTHISVSTLSENHNYIRHVFVKEAVNVHKLFVLFYDDKCKNLNDVIKLTPSMAKALIMRGVDSAIEILNTNGVYIVSEEAFINEYLSIDIWNDTYDEIKEQYDFLIMSREQQEEYLKQNTSFISFNLNKKVFHNEIKNMMATAIGQNVLQIQFSVIELLNQLSPNKCCSYDSEEIDQATAICEAMRAGRISDKDIPHYFSEIISLYPYACDVDTYEWLIQKYKDPKGEIEAISKFFNFDIVDYKIKICDDIFKDLDISQNSSEEEIQEAKELIDEACKEYSVDNSKYFNILNDFWNTLDINLRTVEGIVYESRIEAVKVKNDIAEIINVCKGKNLEDMEIVVSLKNHLDEHLFQSKAVSKSYIYRLAVLIKKYIEHQEYIRRISKIHDLSKNTYVVFEKRAYYKKLEKRMYFRCFTEKFRDKFLNVKTVTGVNTNEHIAFYYDSSITGNGNSGILVTKENLYLYESIFNKSLGCNCIPMGEIIDIHVEKSGTLKVNTTVKEYKCNINVLNEEDIQEATSDFQELVLICKTASVKEGETDNEPVENEQMYQELLIEKNQKSRGLKEQIDNRSDKSTLLSGIGRMFKKKQ